MKYGDIAKRANELQEKKGELIHAIKDSSTSLRGESLTEVLASAAKDKRYSTQVLLKEYWNITQQLEEFLNSEV